MADFPSRNTSRGEDQGLKKAFQHVRRGCSFVDVWLQNFSYAIVNHFLWKLLIVLFTIVLLFGRPCQVLFFPTRVDTVIRILNTVGLVIFVIDMIFNSYLNPTYLPFVSCNRNCKPNAIHSTNYHRRKCCPCVYVGSFNFWCDFISTLCFFQGLDYFGLGSFFVYDTITISVNDLGIPDQEKFQELTSEVNNLWRSDRNLVILIFKTARVARLLPPKRVLEIMEKINIVWYNIRISSYFSWNHFCNQLRMKKEPKEKKNSSTAHRSKEIKRLARRAMKEEDVKIKEKGKLVYAGYLLRKWTEKALKFLRIIPNRDIELDRQISAIRIQRAWRNRNAIYTESRSEEGEGSQAWKSNRDGMLSVDVAEPPGRRSRVAGSSIRAPKDSVPVDQNDVTNSRKLQPRRAKRKEPSQVGAAMARLTGQRVAVFLFVNLLLVSVLTYNEGDTTYASTMVILHEQTTRGNRLFAEKAVDTARRTTIPNLYSYSYIVDSTEYNITYYKDDSDLRENERRSIIIKSGDGQSTGLFSIKKDVNRRAVMELCLLFFVLVIWFFGVAAFAGPIMALVITPIERAVKLLNMLVMDPLGYQSTLQYKNFLADADKVACSNGRWTREVLKGMETEFLNSTIERIGSLMKVGFGSAGVQIIRNNLQKGHNKDTGTLLLNSQGSIVSCIFVFCDIRSFTDATECLQEEVFVFTNRIAAVVHSICSSYGGSANKNIGDAFLVSWRLDGRAIRHQADKALLSVVKICIALHYNNHYVEMLSEHAKGKLLTKLKDRPGPTVQLGFGLHAGKAVEGAIGSQRKIDATYVSTAVELAEYLESSTKKYKVPLLMSGSFHRLLQPSRRQRCRKIDRVMVENENEDFYEEDCNQGKMMELFTYDIDVDALWDDAENESDSDNSESSDGDELIGKPSSLRNPSGFLKLSKSDLAPRNNQDDKLSGSTRSRGGEFTGSIRARGGDITAAIAAVAAKALGTGPTVDEESSDEQEKIKRKKKGMPELVLPTGPALYSENVWLKADMRRIRRRYTTKIFDLYNLGLQKFYSKRWDEAKIHFEAILDCFEDGPSLYFLAEIRKRQKDAKK